VRARLSGRPGLALAASLAAALTVLVAACGEAGTGGLSTGGDVANGEKLFKQNCGSCHTLAAAGTAGVIGPNLDNAFASDRAQGFDQSTIQQVVSGQIKFPIEGHTNDQGQYVTSTGAPAMPADIVTGDDVTDVAAYVASVAGKPVTTKPGGGQAQGGKEIFQQNCGSCHTLADAGTSGNVGPNLDQAKPPKALVVDRVTNGKGPMPAFGKTGVLTPAQIQAVADYVSSSAGR
jgi:cbb3-type cytochrome c oxidase subunit III